jgi:hypothetical protein
MRRSMTAFLSLCLLAAAPTAAMARRAPAVAVSAETRSAALAARADRASILVEAHFKALAAGDGKAVRALWTRDARITSIDGAGKRTRQKLSAALARWRSRRDGMSWTIEGVHHISDREVEVTARVVWGGTTFDDTLRLEVARNGSMKLAFKSSRPHAEVAPAFSPY